MIASRHLNTTLLILRKLKLEKDVTQSTIVSVRIRENWIGGITEAIVLVVETHLLGDILSVFYRSVHATCGPCSNHHVEQTPCTSANAVS